MIQTSPFSSLLLKKKLLWLFLPAVFGLVLVAEASDVHDEVRNLHHHPTSRRHLQKHVSLQDKWFFRQDLTYEIDNSTASSTGASTSNSLRLSFQTSDFIQNDMGHVKIFDSDTCSILVDDETLRLYGIHLSNPTSNDAIGNGLGIRDWTFNIDFILPTTEMMMMNDNILGSNNSTNKATTTSPQLYHEQIVQVSEEGVGHNTNSSSPAGMNHTIGYWKFCLVIALTAPTENGGEDVLINYQDYIFEIEDDFDLQTLNVKAFGQVTDDPNILPPLPNINVARAFFCDTNNNELIVQPVLLEGEELRICVEPPIGYIITGIDSFKYRSYDSSINQAAINVGGNVASNTLTHFTCIENENICIVQTLLFAGFYKEQTEIIATGYANFTHVDGEGGSDVDPAITGSQLYLNFETLLRVIPVLPPTFTLYPTKAPTEVPTSTPTLAPTASPSEAPSQAPSMEPTSSASIMAPLTSVWTGFVALATVLPTALLA